MLRARQGRFAVVCVGPDSMGRNAGSSNALLVLYWCFTSALLVLYLVLYSIS